MRTDYILYIVAAIFFIITGMVAIYQVEFQQLWILGTAVLGLFFAGLGYTQRQRPTPTQAITAPPASTLAVVQPIAVEEVKKEESITTVETTPTLDMTQVKGVKTKRAEQLRALGINSVDDLANASAKNLGSKLKISPKITEKWITDAKALIQKSKKQ